MKNKTALCIIAFATLAALSVFGSVLVHAFWYDPSDMAAVAALPFATVPKNYSLSQGNPIQLEIPSLNVSAHVQDVGVTVKGNMATPNNFTDVGWYKYGTLPGENGSVVIAGHVDNGLAFPGVFKHLGDLSKGDDIFVETQTGQKIHYQVVSLATYPYNANAESVFSQNDDRYLKLITCAGEWVPSYHTHDKRLVVTAVQV